MDTTSLILNIVALVASATALALSSILAIRQSRIAFHANQLPVLVEIIRQIASPSIYGNELLLQEELPKHDPKLGFRGLPEPLRSHAYEVSAYYLMIGYLVLLEILDERLAVLPIHYRATKVWSVIKPFVYGERSIRQDPLSFMNVLEEFIVRIEHADIPSEVARVKRAFRVL